MPTIDPYPTISENGPRPTRFWEDEPEYLVTVGPPYVDGGTDRWLRADDPVRRFNFEYDQLTETEAAILDEHFASAKGKAYGFDFTQPRTGEPLEDVHYDDYQRGKSDKRWIQHRTVRLILRP